jgi:mannose/cellobiose epimerase-like protein (N-acyl-D-glucosamine 2-epimerase family)
MFPKRFIWRRTMMIFVVSMLALILASPTLAQDFPIPPPGLPAEGMFLDVEWYRQNHINAADRWNGGIDGQSGMGAYQEDFDGFFHVNLDRQWNQTRMMGSTSVAQSRAIYMNVEAYRTAGAEEGQRFLDAAIAGTDFLLENFWDDNYGGFYWMVSATGLTVDNQKQGYGNVHPLFALAHVYDITQNPVYLQVAFDQLAILQEHFIDPDYPGTILPGFTRDFSEIMGVNNIDTFTHYFEALLALYDVTEGDQQEQIADMITLHGDFLVNTLYQDQEGFDDRGYVAYNYDDNWQPSQEPYTRETQWSGARQATTGHNIELAYLLSRAVERGFNEEWLTTADKLIKFCLEYAIDPTYGGMLYDITDYDGSPLDGNPDNTVFIWWAQAETARAFLHFTVVRNADFVAHFEAVQILFTQHQTDLEYGGLYANLDITRDLAPTSGYKGDIWKTNYHYNMYFTEVLRLAATYPERVAALNAD